MKDRILELLRQESGYLSGQEMSTLLGVSRAAVWKAVEALRKEGYTIDSAPNRGYHLDAPTGRLSAREIAARAGRPPLGGAGAGFGFCRLHQQPGQNPGRSGGAGRHGHCGRQPDWRPRPDGSKLWSPPQGWEYTCQSFSGRRRRRRS